MNWLSWAFRLSTPSWASSAPPQEAMGEPSTRRASSARRMIGASQSISSSGSTSVSQSSSVTLFHWDAIALL